MEYLKGQSRTQLTLYTTWLDDMIHQDNSVRAIDLFVASLNLKKLGFKTITCQGRPPYDPDEIFKLQTFLF